MMGPGLLIVLAVCAVLVVGAFLLTRSPHWKRLILRRATMHAARGRIDRMMSLLERNRDASSVVDPLTNALIYFFISAGKTDMARELVEQAISLGDDSASAVAQLGFIAGADGERDEAEKRYREALSIDPALRSTLNVNLAALLIERGTGLDEAGTLLREALELREGASKSGVHMNLALLHLARREGREALVQSLTGYELLPAGELTREARSHALALASKAYQLLEDMEEARKMAAKALRLVEGTPGEAALRQQLGTLLAPE